MNVSNSERQIFARQAGKISELIAD